MFFASIANEKYLKSKRIKLSLGNMSKIEFEMYVLKPYISLYIYQISIPISKIFLIILDCDDLKQDFERLS